MTLLLDSLFSSVALGHMMVDILNGQRAILLAYLSGPLGLTNATLGLLSTIYVVSGALSQPLFGLLTDRIGPRWVASGGVFAMGMFFSLAMLADGPAALALLMAASLSSGAFHPAGTMEATLRGRSRPSGGETTSAALFFFFGQAGNFFGPLVGGPLLDRFGPPGLLLISGLALPAGVNTAWQLRGSILPLKLPLKAPAAPSETAAAIRRVRPSPLTLLVFGLMAAFQAWSQQNMITFMPKYLLDMGQAPTVYGSVAALFIGGSALGNAFGGPLADRFGKRQVAMLSLSLAAVPLYLVSIVGWSPWLYVLIPLAGALTGSVHSVIVVSAQRFAPGGIAFASGLILGFMFSSGALGTFISGFIADQTGFPFVFQMTALLALVAAGLASVLGIESSASNPHLK